MAVLRTIDDALRIALVVFLVAALGVVIAHHVDGLWIFRLVRHHHACQRTCDGTRRIDVPHHGRQPLGNLSDALGIRLLGLVAAIHRLCEVLAVAVENRVRIGVVGIVHLIADGPQEHRRVVAVAAHHVCYVAVNPFLEEVERALIARRAAVPAFEPLPLRELPLVAGLVHDEESQLVAEVVEHRCLWVVAHADGIHANLLQLLQPMLPHLRRHDGSQHAGIMVQTHALHLHPLTVQGEAVVRVELQRAQSCSNHAAIHRCRGVVARSQPRLYII